MFECFKLKKLIYFSLDLNLFISFLDQLINILQVSLHQKDLELHEWAEKYKKNVEKAKSVVKCMDSKNISLSDVDSNVLQNRLIKANKELHDLKVCIIKYSALLI